MSIEDEARRAFDRYADGFDTDGDEWQDTGADEYFIAGFKAGSEGKQELLEALLSMRKTMYSNDSEESIKADAAITKATKQP